MTITERLSGKTLEVVRKNRHVLELQFTDGTVCRVAWHGEDGQPVEGEPKATFCGIEIAARHLRIAR